MALKRNVPFVNGFEDVVIPAGKQVSSVNVIKDGPREFVQITVVDEPPLPAEVIGSVTIER